MDYRHIFACVSVCMCGTIFAPFFFLPSLILLILLVTVSVST